MRRNRLLAPLVFCLAACGGGGGGGSNPPPPPPPPFFTPHATGLAVGSGLANAAAIASLVLFPVSETEMGVDLNGDGDTLDQVVHSVDTLTDQATNLGYAIVGRIRASDTQFAFLVSESGQGGRFLNGDVDAADAVWFVYDPTIARTTDNPHNTMVATPATGLPGEGTTGGFLLVWSESAAGQDFTTDGDLLDNIIVVATGSNFTVIPLANLAYAANRPIVVRSGICAVAVSEAARGVDMNGDGDMIDQVLAGLRLAVGAPLPFLVGGAFGRAVANHPYAVTDGAIVYMIDEASDGNTDRNGDGDASDAILAVFDVATAGGETLPMNGTLGAAGVAVTPQVGIATSGDRAIVGIDERAQGQRDLNADMDFFDSAVGWVDTAFARGVVHYFPFTLALRPQAIDGHRGIALVNERSMGVISGVDLNGDLDDSDDVAFLLDTENAPGTLTNLGLAAGPVSVGGDDALVGIPEANQANVDRNGDGDTDDIVLTYLDLSDLPPTPRGTGLVALASSHFRLSGTEVRIAALAAEGQSPTFDRLNADGDSTDNAIVLVHVNPSALPPLLVAPTPLPAGTTSAFVAPPLRAGSRVWVFATSEAMAGADLNGDGDQNDAVLSYVRLSTP